MTESEGRALARTTVVLLVAAAVRWGWSSRQGPPVVHADSAVALPGLLDESREALDDAQAREAPLAPGEMLDPNTASDVELDRLPGVGAATALAIVATREATGGFTRPEDLLEVRGVGPATLDRMRPHLAFAGGGGAGAPTRGPPPAADRGAPAAAPAAGVLVDLNAATGAELEALPGVGPALAERILEARAARGGFSSVDDLLDVRGIGPALLARLRPLVRAPEIA